MHARLSWFRILGDLSPLSASRLALQSFAGGRESVPAQAAGVISGAHGQGPTLSLLKTLSEQKSQQAREATGPAMMNRRAPQPVCGEFQFRRRLGSEISRGNGVARYRTQVVRWAVREGRSDQPAWLRPARYDSGGGCSRLGNARASAENRGDSKIRSDQDIHAVSFRSGAQRKHGNAEHRAPL